MTTPEIFSARDFVEGLGQNEGRLIYPKFSLIDLLSYVKAKEIFYFESKDEDFIFLGLGVHQTIPAAAIDSYLKNNPDSHLVLQTHFENANAHHAYLPEWYLIQRGNETQVYMTEQAPSIFSIFNLKENKSDPFLNSWKSCQEIPLFPEWEARIQKALILFATKELDKIVLSRKKVFSYANSLDSIAIFQKLYLANCTSSHFSIFQRLENGDAFISFTPEKLFTLKGQELESISLAGSTPRGSSVSEDEKQEEILITSKKLTAEHQIVTQNILSQLSSLSHNVYTSPLFTMKLPYVQHRQAIINAQLKSDVTISDLIEKLHPTPAVGGLPQNVAREKILEIEKEKRNSYAAPIGILSSTFSEIAVGIRSAIIHQSALTIYGGVGIVPGSIALEEWAEAEYKMAPFLNSMNQQHINGK